MSIGKLGKVIAGIVGMAMFAISAPASAQLYSDGYLFLKAVDKKEIETVNEMLDTPGSTVVNARDLATGTTGLHIVVARRDLTWIGFLAQNGANPNIRDKKGVTPLVLASQLGFVEGVRALISRGARVDVANNAGETPLMLAMHSRNTALMRILLDAGANVDRYDNSGRSARDYAKIIGNSTLQALERYEKEKNSEPKASSYGPSF